MVTSVKVEKDKVKAKKGKRKFQPAAVTVELLKELQDVTPTGFTSDSERVRYAIREFLRRRQADLPKMEQAGLPKETVLHMERVGEIPVPQEISDGVELVEADLKEVQLLQNLFAAFPKLSFDNLKQWHQQKKLKSPIDALIRAAGVKVEGSDVVKVV